MTDHESGTCSALARHEAEIVNLRDDIKEIKSDVRQMMVILNQAQGGWRAMLTIAGLASAISAVVVKFLMEGVRS